MKSLYFVSLIFTVTVATTYWYQSTAYICPVPLSYRIGSIDDSFNLTLEEARQYAETAEQTWESEFNRDLFVYDENSSFTIDFIFDERQQAANSEASMREALDKKWEESEEVRKTVESLQSEYRSISEAYSRQVDSYENRLREYNARVNRYNDRGGAPSDVFVELEAERIELSRESNRLNTAAQELNDFANNLNRLSDRGNLLVNLYNQEVNLYNKQYGSAKEFTQGDYQGKNIRIYKFSSEEEIVTVLAHEFGHSLGIGHVEGEASLMYYLLGDTSTMPVLSPEDKAAFFEVCGEFETTEQKIRRIIRQILT